ncbi:MAG: hypothetical protein E7653_04310 [Ruminococcaceae bacterium]|nr:hypothetical protein [Oscillospiraceae bacterium]
MRIDASHPSIRLTGRWDTSRKGIAETTNTGSYIDFAFEGRTAIVLFDASENHIPQLHLWISVDDGPKIEALIDNYMRIVAPDDGKHTVRIIYKSGTEQASRWYRPLHGKVTFVGVVVDKPVDMPEDDRLCIEFVGDSITEGILVNADYVNIGHVQYDVTHLNCPYHADVCETYAWRTAEALDLRPCIMGFGAVGVTKGGQGKVPAATEAYPYNFDGSPVTRKKPNIVVLNHGTNDPRANVPNFLEKYELMLDVIKEQNPEAVVVSLTPFGGKFHEEIGKLVGEYNAKHSCNVYFVDTFGWISPEPVHPLRDGHATVAKNFIPILDKIIKENFN